MVLALKLLAGLQLSILGPLTPAGGLLLIAGWLVTGWRAAQIKRAVFDTACIANLIGLFTLETYFLGVKGTSAFFNCLYTYYQVLRSGGVDLGSNIGQHQHRLTTVMTSG